MKRKHIYRLIFCFVMAFAFGSLVGKISSHFLRITIRPEFYEKSQPSSASLSSQSENWGLGFQEKGTRPTGNASIEELKNTMPGTQMILMRKKYISLSTQAMIMETHLPFWMPYINITYMPHFLLWEL